ncbi:MAG: IS1380 family transposase [Planctomycetes bacterium]|nr:IS1380 family transposase [Planctomycetota bacterium]
MKQNISKKLAKRKKKIAKRLKKRNWEKQSRPMLSASNIHYDIDGRNKGTANGGIGIVHQLAGKSGLANEIDERLELLKRHLPYHESDHVLNIAYNILAGGQCLQDIELLRNDEAWLDALGAQIIPDPTTAGDFLRRFKEEDIIELMEVKNTIRKIIWQQQPKSFLKQADICVDGTISPTYGECKQGMDISYNGLWGYHPLVVSLTNTREPLYIINRSGNAPSHLDSAEWIDKSLDLVCEVFEKVRLRGDTDFSLTSNFDKWDPRCMFVFGVDAMANLVKIADDIDPSDWQLLEKIPKYEIKTKKRRRPENVKAQVVKKRKFKNVQTESEHIAEFLYKPGKCKKTYRMIVLRKTIKVTKGELKLFDDIRYFFYITNDMQMSSKALIEFYRGRADHENDIEQLKNGVHALQPASDSLLSNWAYMVIASLAWDLKAWFGMLLPYRHLGLQVLRMEFKRFINTFIKIPCLIIKTARRICYRLVGYNAQLKHMLNFSRMLKTFSFQ